MLVLGNEVFHSGFVAQDSIEWMPFLKAYALAGDIESLQKINRYMKKADPFVFHQVCQALRALNDLPIESKESIDIYFCEE